MKKILSLISAMLMMLGTANANLIVQESFSGENGTVGQLCKGTNTDMGINTANWWSYSGSSNYIQVAEGSLTYPGYQSTGKGNKAYLYSAGADDFRQFESPVTSGKVYLAAIINVDELKNSTTSDYCLCMGDATASGMSARLYTKSVKDGGEFTGFKLGVAKTSESATYVGVTDEVYEPQKDYLVVLEYEFIDGEKNDVARLYVNPTKQTTTPTLECVQSVQSGSGAEQGANSKNDASKIASVNLRQGSNTPKIYIDEIRVATAWDDLWNDDTPGSGDTPGDDTKPEVTEVENNLIANPGFEDYSCSQIFGCSFDDWSGQGAGATADASDKLLGNVALCMNPTSTTVLDQPVALSDANYAAGSKFELTMYYKVVTMPADGSVAIDSYWEAAPGGDAEATKAHDADVLQQVLATTTTGWQCVKVQTTKPAKSSYLRVRLKVSKSAKVLADAFSLVYKASTDPYIEVSPLTLSPLQVNIGQTQAYPTVHIRQGNLSGATTFELSGTDADQFALSMTSMPADQGEGDLIITYKPTKAGSHTALLNIDNLSHTELFQSISLKATCVDPSQQPVITVTPSTVPAFEAVEGQTVTKTVSVTSENCIDHVYMRVNHITGEGFTIDGTMLPKNATSTVTISFKPQAAGNYESKLTIYSQNADDVVLTLTGTAEAKSEENIDWQTSFNWQAADALTQLNEQFNGAEHNKTLVLAGWQNVADLDARPWWGFEESKTTPARGDGKYAKATAYQFGKSYTADWQMWLVTPLLDYKNAANKVFTFKVMGEYLADENQAALEIYYIDPNAPSEPYFQDLTESFSIPKTSDENLTWIPFVLDLTPFAETIGDVFYMAFKYIGPNGADGAVTYYIDDVTWGVDPSTASQNIRVEAESRKILRGGQLLILRDGKTYNTIGAEIR